MIEFSEADRAIFGPYPNGGVDSTGRPMLLHGDPMRIHRRLCQALGGRADTVLADCHADEGQAPDEDERAARQLLALAATEKLLQATVEAFELKPLNQATGQGLRETEIMKIMNSFLDWLDNCKKKVETPPFSPQSTAPPASEILPMPNGSASGSTDALHSRRGRQPLPAGLPTG